MKKIAILGAGVNGITVGNLILDKFPGSEVTIYADKTKGIVSNVACAQFYPIWLGDSLPKGYDKILTNRFLFSKAKFEEHYGAEYGIKHLRNHELFKTNERPPKYFHKVLSNFESCRDSDLPLDYTHRFSFDTIIVDVDVYMPKIMDDFIKRGGKLVSRKFLNIKDVTSLDESIIFNCMGMGSREVFGDNNLEAVKGVILLLKPNNQINLVVSAGEFIIAPRQNNLYIGSLYSEKWETIAPTQKEIDYLFDNVKSIMETPGSIFSIPKNTLRKKDILECRSGFRPFRTTGPRVDKEVIDKKVIIHNYGHGGSGIILSWGTAAEAINLL